jgi:GDSL-like Lipase/Acylhydrolase family
MTFAPHISRAILKRAALALLSFIFVLGLIEAILRVTQLATDIAFVQGDSFLGFKFIPNQAGTFVIGKFGDEKSHFRINSDGWNAPSDYKATRSQGTIRIAIIGDSYVEALNVQPSKGIGAVLEKVLLRRTRVEVYSFGISGASLSHYLALMRYVRSRFCPDLYIINIIHNDFVESLATEKRAIFHGVRRVGDSYEEVSPKIYQPSRFRRIMGHLALVRYLQRTLPGQLGITDVFHALSLRVERHANRFAANVDVTKIDLTETKQLVTYISTRYLREVDDDRQKLVFVLDTPRQAIYEGKQPRTDPAFQYNEVVGEVCRDLALYCLDLTESFMTDFQKHSRRFNSRIDGHWNSYGHQIAGEAIGDFLNAKGLIPNSLVIDIK